jgi:hypothetical protein
MSSLDFCVCGGSKNQNQELCGECRMAEIEAIILKHTWVSSDDDNCDEYDHREEYLIDQEKKNKVYLRECIHCQEEKAKGFDLLCDDCIDLYNAQLDECYCYSCEQGESKPYKCDKCRSIYYAIQHKDQIESLILNHFEENELGGERAREYLLSIKEIKPPKEVVEGLQTPCDCGKNYKDGCECLPF